MEGIERTGVWWLPGKEDRKVSGKLSFDPPVGGTLELSIQSRYFPAEFENDEFNSAVYPIVLGMVHSTKFSLRQCIAIDGDISQTKDFWARRIVFAIDTIFQGCHFNSIDEIVFEHISAGYTYLEDWMDQRNFRSGPAGSIQYVQPEPTTIQLDNSSISFGAGTSGHSSRTKVTMKEECWVTVTPNSPLHFDEIRDFMEIQLPNFLTLATGLPNYPLKVTGSLPNGNIPQVADVYFRVPGYIHKPQPTSVEYMLFTYEDIRQSPSKYLPAWMDKSQQLLSVFELYFQTVYSRSLSTKTLFLLLAQALEAYHRNLYGGYYLSDNTYKKAGRKIKNAIPDCVEGEHRSNLEAMINNGNQFSLKTRIMKICDEILPSHLLDGDIVIVDSLLTDAEGRFNKEDFLEKVKGTRNYLTHHPKNRSATVIPDNELFLYVAKIRFLLRICFLVELRFPSDRIKDRVIQNPEYKSLIGSW